MLMALESLVSRYLQAFRSFRAAIQGLWFKPKGLGSWGLRMSWSAGFRLEV